MINDFLIRLTDQSGKECKFYYKNITKEEFDKICAILNAKSKDFN